jgi:hypothetical protein
VRSGWRGPPATPGCRSRGELDAAAGALTPVLPLTSGQRIDTLPKLLEQTRAELVAPVYRASQQAIDLAEQNEDFSQDIIGRELRGLPLGPS